MNTANSETHHTVRRPLLSGEASIGSSQPIRAQPRHITSKNHMGAGVRSGEVLEVALEVVIIPIERVEGVIDICLRERDVDRRGEIDSRCARESSRVKEVSIVASDVVFGGVGERYVLETTGGDLEIIRRVTPTPETLVSVVREDCGIEKVRSVWICVRAAVLCHSYPSTLPIVQSQ